MRCLELLAGESRLNDATALTAYRVASVTGGGFSVLSAAGQFGYAVAVGFEEATPARE